MCALSSCVPPLQKGTLFEGEDMGLLEVFYCAEGESDFTASSS